MNDEELTRKQQFKREKRHRPSQKAHIDRMIKNYRRIDQKFAIRRERKHTVQSNAQTIRRQNIYIEKQIKKNTFVDPTAFVSKR